jgi:hypothetical protein
VGGSPGPTPQEITAVDASGFRRYDEDTWQSKADLVAQIAARWSATPFSLSTILGYVGRDTAGGVITGTPS